MTARLPVRGDGGFTLLEMLLVVFILSALALTATAFVDNEDDQFRYEDTRRRLAAIRRAIAGEPSAVHAGQVVLSGYVVDNGVLPPHLHALTSAMPSGYATAAPQAPLYDPTPATADGLNDGGETALSGAGATLDKGWAAGRLQTAPGADGLYRDGWGTTHTTGSASPALLADNDGWQWTAPGTTLAVSSLGRDRKDAAMGGVPTSFDADMATTLTHDDWTVPITSLSLRIKAASDFSGGILRASLLVFRNDASTARWRRYTTASNALTCLDGTGDGQAGGAPCATSEALLTFAAHAYPSPWDQRIPIGRHLLVLVNDTDTTLHNGEPPYQVAGTGERIVLPVHCYASGCTTETLILR